MPACQADASRIIFFEDEINLMIEDIWDKILNDRFNEIFGEMINDIVGELFDDVFVDMCLYLVDASNPPMVIIYYKHSHNTHTIPGTELRYFLA